MVAVGGLDRGASEQRPLFALLLYALTASPLLGDHYALIGALQFLAFIQIGLVVLNLLPIPGLDGFGVIEPHLPESVQAALLPLRQVTFVLLLFFVMSPASDVIWDVANGTENWLGIDAGSRPTARSSPRRGSTASSDENRTIPNACSLAGMSSSTSPAAKPNRWAILACSASRSSWSSSMRRS